MLVSVHSSVLRCCGIQAFHAAPACNPTPHSALFNSGGVHHPRFSKHDQHFPPQLNKPRAVYPRAPGSRLSLGSHRRRSLKSCRRRSLASRCRRSLASRRRHSLASRSLASRLRCSLPARAPPAAAIVGGTSVTAIRFHSGRAPGVAASGATRSPNFCYALYHSSVAPSVPVAGAKVSAVADSLSVLMAGGPSVPARETKDVRHLSWGRFFG